MSLLPKRPDMLSGISLRRPTTAGTMFVTVNYDDDFTVQEVIINVGKAGAESHAMAEALGRMISAFLRHECQHCGEDRLELVIEQLAGITSTPRGNGRSMPDALSDALKDARQQITELIMLAKAEMRQELERIRSADGTQQ